MLVCIKHFPLNSNTEAFHLPVKNEKKLEKKKRKNDSII